MPEGVSAQALRYLEPIRRLLKIKLLEDCSVRRPFRIRCRKHLLLDHFMQTMAVPQYLQRECRLVTTASKLSNDSGLVHRAEAAPDSTTDGAFQTFRLRNSRVPNRTGMPMT